MTVLIFLMLLLVAGILIALAPVSNRVQFALCALAAVVLFLVFR